MKTLSGLDTSFLYLETPQKPMHVGSLQLCELPKGFRGSFAKALREHIASRLHLAPILTQRLALMPFELGHPRWVEADEVDRSRPLWQFHVVDSVVPRSRCGATSHRAATPFRAGTRASTSVLAPASWRARSGLQDLCEARGDQVSLISWSLGGVYARELAKEFPQFVRCHHAGHAVRRPAQVDQRLARLRTGQWGEHRARSPAVRTACLQRLVYPDPSR
jgi:hypothetical protein